jgi:hypothetical protein
MDHIELIFVFYHNYPLKINNPPCTNIYQINMLRIGTNPLFYQPQYDIYILALQILFYYDLHSKQASSFFINDIRASDKRLESTVRTQINMSYLAKVDYYYQEHQYIYIYIYVL